jgi:hypothetical protein
MKGIDCNLILNYYPSIGLEATRKVTETTARMVNGLGMIPNTSEKCYHLKQLVWISTETARCLAH